MKRELGIARCGLACCLCSKNESCPGCHADGCTDKDWCENRKCSLEKGLQSCAECPEECRKGLLGGSKAYGFLQFARRYGEAELMDCLERNERAGLVYHREGFTGDYDGIEDLEELFRLIQNGREPFGIDTFRREITAELGKGFWNELAEDITLPDIETEGQCACRNMVCFLERLESQADPETVKRILCRVRHGIRPSQVAWAREEFLKLGDLDAFLKQHLENELAAFVQRNAQGEDFFGQEITDEVLEFVKEHPSMLAPVREGNKLHCMAFPGDMAAYLKAQDPKIKRYYACHCPFARESILAEKTVSPTLCNCSLGHVMNFTEGFLGRALEGRVVRSVLNGDLTCEYEITLPDDIMKAYVKTE